MLSVGILCVIILSVILLSVVAPYPLLLHMGPHRSVTRIYAFNQGTLTEGERISTIDLLVLVTLDLLRLILQTLFTLFQNNLPQSGGYLYKAFTFQLVFPDSKHSNSQCPCVPPALIVEAAQ
jgi:hypothetical protein